MIQKSALRKPSSSVIILGFFLLCLDRGDSWPCTHQLLIVSSASFNASMVSHGTILSYKYKDPRLIPHPCEAFYFGGQTPPAIYLGEKVFLSHDNFQSSLLPLTIPDIMESSPAEVTSALFVQNNRALFVVNEKVYLYFYSTWKTWKISTGIDNPVTDITNMDCCYSLKDINCYDTSNFIVAYTTGKPAQITDVFTSNDGGYRFVKTSPANHESALIGIYNFISLAQLGVILNKTDGDGEAYFTYTNLNLVHLDQGAKFELKFYADESVIGIIPPGLRGFILLWTKDCFVFSFNHGLNVNLITVHPTDKYVNVTLPLHDKGLCNVAANRNEIAALTKSHKLFYGTLDMESTQMVHIGDKTKGNPTDPCEAMMFENIGVLFFVSLVPSTDSALYHFQKCIINIQDTLMTLRPPLQPCPVEILSGDFHNKIYYIDMKQELHFNVTFVPKPGTGTYPYVTVSNPHALAFQADIDQDGFTFDGNTKYRLHIRLLQQAFAGMSQSEFQDTLYSSRISTVTVDIYNKAIFCIDMHPLTALIVVGCSPKKHIKISESTTACNRGLFQDIVLQNSFVYSINRAVYDPQFLGRKKLAQPNLNITYRYDLWRCPILLYYDSPWLPILELWDNDEFIEYVSADFVLYEIHGMHNYDYLLNEVEAECRTAAQNWISIMTEDPGREPSDMWNRLLYENCKIAKENGPLPSASRPYHVLNMNEKNRILFPQYNGIYVFKAIVVDTQYSYCDLTTVFSVYVHGALPKSQINVGKTLISFLVLIFGSILMVYYFPKLMKENARMKTVWA
ncbi:cation channel sperm-associated protein subunit delta [Lacerta agilis]|uniref:cation channel sperm-associated protein subunit delta n=1 Tax=Lacerta agilis TaxID=80427 RepID=UPI00141A295B|nr:cation channel sperm-associated protein subunit delta [Lacerta agilis]